MGDNDDNAKAAAWEREAKLAAALRANLRRRKAETALKPARAQASPRKDCD